MSEALATAAAATGRRRLALLTAVGASAAGAAAPLMLDTRRAVLALALTFCSVCLVGIWSAASSGARPVQLVFWSFTFAWLGVGQVYQVVNQQLAWRDYFLLGQTSTLIYTQLLLIGTHAALLAGSLLARRRRSGTASSRGVVSEAVAQASYPDSETQRFVVSRRARQAEYLSIAAASAITAVVSLQAGGLSTLFLSRSERGAVLASEGITTSGGAAVGFVRLLPVALATVAAFLAVRRLRNRPSGDLGARWTPWLTLALAVIICNPLSNTRFIAFSLLGVIAVAAAAPRRPAAGFALAGTTVAAFIVGYPLSEAIQAAAAGRDVTGPTLAALAGKDFDGFQTAANGVLFVEANGHGWGLHVLSAVLFFVPRSLWPGKATPASIEVAEFRRYFFTDLSLPLPAELYLDLGWLGAIPIMFALGLLVERLDWAWLTAPGSRLAFAVPVMAMAQIGLLRGPLGSLGPNFGILLILTILAARYVLPGTVSSASALTGVTVDGPRAQRRDTTRRPGQPHG